MVLSFLDFDAGHRQPDGFVEIEALREEAQTHGYTVNQAMDILDRLTDRRLIETPHRAAFSDDGQMELAPPKEKFRLTARGAYHLLKWVPTFAYVDAMVFDTPIFDERLRDEALTDLESFDIKVRYARATDFRKYLVLQWRAAEIRASYFDFEAILRRGDWTFQAVQQHAR